MSKIVLIGIAVVAVVLLVVGYFLLTPKPIATLPTDQNSPNQDANATQQSGKPITTFDVQGVKVEVERVGTGVAAKTGDKVMVNYVGTFTDGTKFDSSYDTKKPLVFSLGQKGYIKGFSIGIEGMKVGEKRKLTIPPDLGYGANGFLIIPKNATLIFTVELLKIN